MGTRTFLLPDHLLTDASANLSSKLWTLFFKLLVSVVNLDLHSEGRVQQIQSDSVLCSFHHYPTPLKSIPTLIPDCLNGSANSISSLVVQHTSLGTILPTLLGACLAIKSGYRSRGDYWGPRGASVLSCSEFLSENKVLILTEK